MAFKVRQIIKNFLNRIFLPLIYFLSRGAKVEPDSVIFADGHFVRNQNSDRPFNFEKMYLESEKNGLKIKEFYIDFGTCGTLAAAKFMIRFMHSYARCERVYICNYFLPVSSCKKRSETTVIQLWHACGCLKKFGFDATDDIPPELKADMNSGIDFVTVSAPSCVKPFSSALKIDEKKVLPVGVSRTDIYYDIDYAENCRKEFFEKYPQYSGKKIVLYAPTFRENAGNPKAVGVEAVLALEKLLPDNYVLITKLHPHMEKTTGQSSYDIITERLFPVVSILITDYSSVIFDFCFFSKPVVLFAPDLQKYISDRGFYFDYGELPGTLVTKPSELCEAVVNAEKTFDEYRLESFRKKYLSACDGEATKRISNLKNI